MLASGSFKARTAVTTNLATMIGFTHSIPLYLFPQTSILLSSPEYSYLLNAISLQACMYLSMLFFYNPGLSEQRYFFIEVHIKGTVKSLLWVTQKLENITWVLWKGKGFLLIAHCSCSNFLWGQRMTYHNAKKFSTYEVACKCAALKWNRLALVSFIY